MGKDPNASIVCGVHSIFGSVYFVHYCPFGEGASEERGAIPNQASSREGRRRKCDVSGGNKGIACQVREAQLCQNFVASAWCCDRLVRVVTYD